MKRRRFLQGTLGGLGALETHPESPPGDWVAEFLREEFSGLLN